MLLFFLIAALKNNLNEGKQCISGSFRNQQFINKTEYIKANAMHKSRRINGSIRGLIWQRLSFWKQNT